MASSSPKRASCEALAAYLAAQVPSLSGKIAIGAADPEQKMKHPWLQILPHRWNFASFSPQTVNDDDDTTPDAVIDVGSWEGIVELRVVSSSQPMREQLEAAITAALFPNECAASVVTVTIPSYQFETSSGTVITAVTVPATFEIDGGDWQDEMAWDKHRFSYMELEAQVPALILKQNVGNIDAMVQELLTSDTVDLTTDPATDAGLEIVQVNQDGTITNTT